ncbi:MAG: 2OG-Fe(II) oxygenase [Acidimicrobiales bacterium]
MSPHAGRSPAPDAAPAVVAPRDVAGAVDALDWERIGAGLDESGVAPAGPVLSPALCAELVASSSHDASFRSTVDMARHRFGAGIYRYFAYPLPAVVEALRQALWPHLLPVAREWAGRRNQPAPWDDRLDDWLARCHRAGQARPTPLLLSYGPGDWNALHRDLYGDLVFPLQVVVGLDRPGVDYGGGELVVVEQRPRSQSRPTALAIPQGHAVVLTTRDRPARSSRGWTTHAVRHGVSTIAWGHRHTLGVIFHDAA